MTLKWTKLKNDNKVDFFFLTLTKTYSKYLRKKRVVFAIKNNEGKGHK